MRVGRWVLAALILATVPGRSLAGDVPDEIASALRQRAANDLQCTDPVTITSIGGNAYKVAGCARYTTYVCGAGRETTCGRDTPVENDAPSGPTPSAQVARRWNEAHAMHTVVGTFDGFRASATTQTRIDRRHKLELFGAPQRAVAEIQLRFSMTFVPREATACDRFVIRVNDEPLTGTDVISKVEREKWRSQAKASFRYPQFTALARRYATFAVEVCGERLEFTDEQLAELQKFLEIFSQIASDVEQGRLEHREGAAASVTL
jgi:hypothetical protein